MERPKISVCIPVYNVENYLRRCLDSILSQSLREIQLVCVDDASPDGSAAILQEYAQRDPERIKIISKERNEGLMAARRTGYKNADGEYFFFCDSDDYLPADTLETLYKAAIAADADIAAGDFYYEKPDGRRTLVQRSLQLDMTPERYLRAIMTGTLCTLCGSIYHSRLFEGRDYTTFMNHSFAEDRLLLTQLLRVAKRIEPVHFGSYVYFLNNASMTQNRLSDRQLTQLLKAQDWVRRFLSDSPEFAPVALRHYVRYLSFLLESGYDSKFISGFTHDNRELLSFKKLNNILGTRLACHTTLCLHSKLYRETAAAARRTIRKILGR